MDSGVGGGVEGGAFWRCGRKGHEGLHSKERLLMAY